jgi:hypothetical protein
MWGMHNSRHRFECSELQVFKKIKNPGQEVQGNKFRYGEAQRRLTGLSLLGISRDRPGDMDIN